MDYDLLVINIKVFCSCNISSMCFHFRIGIPHILFVVTDGKSDSVSKMRTAAEKIHASNITAFAVGIGRADEDELQVIASDSKKSLHFNSFKELEQLQDSISQDFCKGITRKVYAYFL